MKLVLCDKLLSGITEECFQYIPEDPKDEEIEGKLANVMGDTTSGSSCLG
jgi:hypothetical protein